MAVGETTTRKNREEAAELVARTAPNEDGFALLTVLLTLIGLTALAAAGYVLKVPQLALPAGASALRLI